MAFEAERLEILKMVQSKQITAEDGARLIKALVDDRQVPATSRPAPTVPGARWLKLVAEEPGSERVNLTVPLSAIPLVLRFVERFVPTEHQESLRAAQDAIASGFRGELVRVEQPGGQNVRIWIE
jgi:hypothetical protein